LILNRLETNQRGKKMKKKYLFIAFLVFGLMLVNLAVARTKYFSSNGRKVSHGEYEQLKEIQNQKATKAKQDRIDRLMQEKDEQGRPLYDSKGRKIFYSTFLLENDSLVPEPSGKMTTDQEAESKMISDEPSDVSREQGIGSQERTDWQKTTDEARQKSRSRVRLLQ
jgi:hypothetical protein